LNYGYINLPNDADEVPITVYLNRNDPGKDIKLKLINEIKPFYKFRVVDTLDEKVMSEFLSWVRYVVFDGDMAQLYLVKNECVNEYQKRRNLTKDASDDSDDVDLQDCFKAKNLNPFAMENEKKVWKKIDELVD